jgi:hypothetical protein
MTYKLLQKDSSVMQDAIKDVYILLVFFTYFYSQHKVVTLLQVDPFRKGKSGLSWGGNLVVFYYLNAPEIWPDKIGELVLLTSSGATLIPFHFEVPIYFKVYIDITLSDQVCQSHVTV